MRIKVDGTKMAESDIIDSILSSDEKLEFIIEGESKISYTFYQKEKDNIEKILRYSEYNGDSFRQEMNQIIDRYNVNTLFKLLEIHLAILLAGSITASYARIWSDSFKDVTNQFISLKKYLYINKKIKDTESELHKRNLSNWIDIINNNHYDRNDRKNVNEYLSAARKVLNSYSEEFYEFCKQDEEIQKENEKISTIFSKIRYDIPTNIFEALEKNAKNELRSNYVDFLKDVSKYIKEKQKEYLLSKT